MYPFSSLPHPPSLSFSPFLSSFQMAYYRLYVVGGYDVVRQRISSVVESIDPFGCGWRTEAPLPCPRAEVCVRIWAPLLCPRAEVCVCMWAPLPCPRAEVCVYVCVCILGGLGWFVCL